MYERRTQRIHIINANLKLVKNLPYNLATNHLKFNEIKYHHQTKIQLYKTYSQYNMHKPDGYIEIASLTIFFFTQFKIHFVNEIKNVL